MKKVLAVILCMVLLSACGEKKVNTENKDGKEEEKTFVGIWISYSELADAATGDFKENFTLMCDNALSIGATDLFVHIRPFCDSVYPSPLFPLCSWAKDLDYDVLSFMIETCHSKNLKFHGWINPYRVSTAYTDIEKLDEKSPAKINPDMLGASETGIYLDPSSESARRLILEGIREICESYDIDGIHFDDYFYPTTLSGFDEKNYKSYVNSSKNPLPLDMWRRANVNVLIAGVHSLLNNLSRPVTFSVSPAADIEKNENSLYADIDSWCKAGYIDAVIPQLYFGFEYPMDKFKFENLINQWINYLDECSVYLYIGLAPYKLDTEKVPDKSEWENGTHIVAKQIKLIKDNAAVDGAVLFSYSYIFSDSENFKLQKKEIEKAIKE